MVWRGRARALRTVVGALALVGCGDDGSGMAWEPINSSGSGADDSMGSADDTISSMTDDGVTDTATATATATATDGESCDPGMTQPCLCPDGLSLGEQQCNDDGQGFSECECETEDTESEGSTGNSMPPLPAEICYLGADSSGSACIPLGAFYDELPLGYEYPPSMQPDGQDRPPLGMVDLDAVRSSMALAPNFALDEIATAAAGRWAVIQPHAIESLQAMRNAAGPIGVERGYLSPEDNAGLGGELYARHQYGDGFDLDPVDVDVPTLAGICEAEGGAAVQFEGFIHCEWSAVPMDEDLFGPPPAGGAPHPSHELDDLKQLDAWIEVDGHELWAPSAGFIEGEPRRAWQAKGSRGTVLSEFVGRSFAPPPGTSTVEVVVGGRIHRSIALSR